MIIVKECVFSAECRRLYFPADCQKIPPPPPPINNINGSPCGLPKEMYVCADWLLLPSPVTNCPMHLPFVKFQFPSDIVQSGIRAPSYPHTPTGPGQQPHLVLCRRLFRPDWICAPAICYQPFISYTDREIVSLMDGQSRARDTSLMPVHMVE